MNLHRRQFDELLMKNFDVLVIGGGAAGLFCALTAGRRGRRVAVVEHNDRVGKKIEISGGGRCNFTNIHASPANYLSGNPGFCRSALARFTPSDFISLVARHGIAYHEKKLGQQFCDSSSREIIRMLVDECRLAAVEIFCGCRVGEVRKPARFVVATSLGEFSAESLVVASGGLSFPKLGATPFGHELAAQFGLRVTRLSPGLVPLTWDVGDREAFGSLSGVSLPVEAKIGKVKFRESMLFTHRGVSGPSVLQISSYWDGVGDVVFDLAPDGGVDLAGGRETLSARLSKIWPRRLAEVWCARHDPGKPLAQCSRAEREALENSLHRWTRPFSGTEGYAKAEVTLGGVDTGELSSQTMEARAVPGLFFIGEVVDVTGWLGGYNFQWAWASGHAAGCAV